MMLKSMDITVLGAGVAGLAVGTALAQRGAKVTLLEQADAIREVGAGLQVSPNGAAVMRALGLETALNAGSVAGQAVHLRDGYSGDTVTRLDLTSRGQTFHLMHRADLIEILRKAAADAGVEMQLLQRIEQVDLSGSQPRLITAQGAERKVSFLIGADGLHSKVRAALNGVVAPFFTHQVAWRALIPAEADAPAEAEVHMGAGRHLVSYPLRGGTLRNIVAVEERRQWVEESWNLRDDPMEMRLAFEGFSPRVQKWLEQVDDVWLWGLFRHPVAKRWHGTRAAILGDAAHPTLPFLAQGANMALEDAWVLADCLDRFGPEKGLTAYQSARAHRCARIVQAANGNARAYHLREPMRSLAHLGLRLGGAMAPGLALKRYDWIYSHDVTASR
ncbi:FAD-dependent oxidoreductase (plasmid) [Pseudorhodobacter turbinis]|uniref:FAD-dependent oxidoreductase n=1 Tax=Pseudorhodobacter turbinis TaxID=2500533 RepID=A0A4P8EK27_9RHOB|nr:FAD-dependent monooxygenase [Pseudorhodobacter turbinis]QCO57075.1 FAD-dependent oxidoreductase [Pseudorhodobacter turbinis]